MRLAGRMQGKTARARSARRPVASRLQSPPSARLTLVLLRCGPATDLADSQVVAGKRAFSISLPGHQATSIRLLLVPSDGHPVESRSH